ncbi:MAG: hypothetical protein OHK0039_01230 [Bacteroidia bacterium]
MLVALSKGIAPRFDKIGPHAKGIMVSFRSGIMRYAHALAEILERVEILLPTQHAFEQALNQQQALPQVL